MTTLTEEQREHAFAIRHESWNRIFVIPGPDAEMKAMKYILGCLQGLDELLDDKGFDGDRSDTNAVYTFLQDQDELNSWDVFDDARIAGDEE